MVKKTLRQRLKETLDKELPLGTTLEEFEDYTEAFLKTCLTYLKEEEPYAKGAMAEIETILILVGASLDED